MNRMLYRKVLPCVHRWSALVYKGINPEVMMYWRKQKSDKEVKKRWGRNYMVRTWHSHRISNSALATRINFSVNPIFSFFFASSSLYFSIDISIALRTATTTTKDERRRTNGNTPLVNVLCISCLPWLTIAFYITHLSFDVRSATTMTTTITMTKITMTTRSLLYIAHKGCFKIFLM
jgi:hypothetical protein